MPRIRLLVTLLATASCTSGCTAENPDYLEQDGHSPLPDFAHPALDGPTHGDQGIVDLLPPPPDLTPPDLTAPPRTWIVRVGSGGRNYSPKALTIRQSDVVEWQWASGGHNVVSGVNGVADRQFCSPSDTGCPSAPLSPAGTSYRHAFTTAGVHPYFCSSHWQNGMTGVVTVQ